MSIIDDYENYALSSASPLENGEEVTASDENDLNRMSRALYVGTAGDVRVTLKRGKVVTFANMQTGWHPLRVSRIWATGTTATDLVACS